MFSREINETQGEGGALNANYRTVEAVAVIANVLGHHNLLYGRDFVFKTGGDEISFDFCDRDTAEKAKSHLRLKRLGFSLPIIA